VATGTGSDLHYVANFV